MRKYEIWIGFYSLGMGFDDPKGPELLGTMEATSFKVACYKWELMNSLESINNSEKEGDYIGVQDLEWFYNAHTNENAWRGKYFESKDEAQRTFK